VEAKDTIAQMDNEIAYKDTGWQQKSKLLGQLLLVVRCPPRNLGLGGINQVPSSPKNTYLST